MWKKISKIKKNDIELYLQLWGYDSIRFLGNSDIIKALEKIWDSSLEHLYNRTLTVTDQDENFIISSDINSYGIKQLLYELEVISDIPYEIKNSLTVEGWKTFILRFIHIYKKGGWSVFFSKQIPITDMDSDTDVISNDILLNKSYEKIIILNNGNGGKIDSSYKKYSNIKRIENLRLIVLFRAYLSELLCEHFKSELQKKEVELHYINWNWALGNPLYPKQNIVSSDIEKRSKYALSFIVNNEANYKNFLEDIYGDRYNLSYIREIMDIPNRLQLDTGNVIHENRYGKYLNVSMGERKTEYQPLKYERTIYLMGGCVFFGYAVEDSQTIASYLQKMLNEKIPDKMWRVVNYATWGGDIDWTYKRFYEIPFRPGDIVLISYAGLMPLGLDWKSKDISKYLMQVESSGEFYFNSIVHCNSLGYKKTAAGLFEMFYNSFCGGYRKGETFFLKDNHPKEDIYEDQVNDYLQSVQDQLPDLANKNVGAIVMNCNPFTLGHQHLIEYAASQVEILVIFVVEENKSYFKFNDRIRLVRQGTTHLNNVYVIPSGNMIISTVTFPGYFLKDTPEAVNLDTSLDVTIFGKYIAKAFHIQTRFVGEEPFDIVTRNYNESMKQILPLYGIQLVIIPRKETAGEPISASRVRKLLENRNFSELRKLVPETTYAFLTDHFKSDLK